MSDIAELRATVKLLYDVIDLFLCELEHENAEALWPIAMAAGRARHILLTQPPPTPTSEA